MSALTLALTGTLLLVPAALFIHVGGLFVHRARSGSGTLGLNVFATFWYSAGAVLAMIASHTLLAVVGVRSPTIHLAINYLQNVPLSIALWALLYYLLLVYTGRPALAAPLGVLYVGYFVFLVWYQTSVGPWALMITDWDARLLPATPPPDGLATLYALLFGGPILLALIAYASLYFQVHERTLKYRIAMVSGSILVLFGFVVLSLMLRLEDQAWFPLAYEIPVTLAALGIVAAYQPPGWVRRKWRIRPMEGA